MEALLTKLGVCVLDQGRTKTFLVEWDLVKPLIRTWKNNRAPDPARVEELHRFIEGGGYVPHVMHVADVLGEGLVCFDGNHRREAFALSTSARTVLLAVMMSATHEDVFREFVNINRSVPLPHVYSISSSADVTAIRDAIVGIVKKYEKKYPSYVSTSARCHAPNFNRDAFVDNVFELWRGLGGKVEPQALEACLVTVNDMYSMGVLGRPHAEIKDRVVKKCREQNLWLFVERTVPLDHVRHAMTEMGMA